MLLCNVINIIYLLTYRYSNSWYSKFHYTVEIDLAILEKLLGNIIIFSSIISLSCIIIIIIIIIYTTTYPRSFSNYARLAYYNKKIRNRILCFILINIIMLMDLYKWNRHFHIFWNQAMGSLLLYLLLLYPCALAVPTTGIPFNLRPHPCTFDNIIY